MSLSRKKINSLSDRAKRIIADRYLEIVSDSSHSHEVLELDISWGLGRGGSAAVAADVYGQQSVDDARAAAARITARTPQARSRRLRQARRAGGMP